MTFTVLFVCTGNVCRSPLAEQLLRVRLGERFGNRAQQVEVRSAGTGALVGQGMTDATKHLVRRFGGVAGEHRARQIAEPMVLQADVVLAMTRQHRSAVVRLHPAAVSKAFTLREVARLASLVNRRDLPDEGLDVRLRALVPALAGRRGLVPVSDPTDDDVVDPYRQPDDVYEVMAKQVAPAVATLVALLGGDAAGSRE